MTSAKYSIYIARRCTFDTILRLGRGHCEHVISSSTYKKVKGKETWNGTHMTYFNELRLNGGRVNSLVMKESFHLLSYAHIIAQVVTRNVC